MRKLRPWTEKLLLVIFLINAVILCSIDRITDIIPGIVLIVALMIIEYMIYQAIEKYGHGIMEKEKKL